MAVKLLSSPFVLALLPLPDGVISAEDRAQTSVGYPLAATVPVPPVVPPVIEEAPVTAPSFVGRLPADEHEPLTLFEFPPLIFTVNETLILASGVFVLTMPAIGLEVLLDKVSARLEETYLDRSTTSIAAQCRVAEKMHMSESGEVNGVVMVLEVDEREVYGFHHISLIELDDARLGLL